MTKLRNTRQENAEPVALYAERLMSVAKEAYKLAIVGLPDESYSLIDQQLVSIFIERLRNPHVKAKVIRGNPTKIFKAVDLAIEEGLFRNVG